MNSVPAVLDTDVRVASSRARAEQPHDSPKATFQDAVDARREDRARAASERDEARTEDAPVDREPVREPEAEEAEEPQAQDPERATDAREPRKSDANSAPNEGGSTRRETARNAKGASQDGASSGSGDAVLAALDLGGLAKAAPDFRPPMALPETVSSAPTTATASPVRGDALPSEPRVATQDSASSGAATTAGLEAVAATGSTPTADGQANASAARAAIHAVDPRSAVGAAPTAPAQESAPAREPFAPRLSAAELPDFLQSLVLRVDSPQRSAVVELEPAELGRVSISLSLEREGHVRADVHTQRPEGYAALEARLPELRASLIERGFLDASVNLSLGLPDARSQRSGAESGRENPSLRRGRTLAASEIQSLLPAAPSRDGSIDLWA